MKPMIRRLQLLEQTYEVEEYVDREDSPANIVRARRLQRLQAEGLPIPPEEPRRSYPRGTSVAEILRGGRQRVHEKLTSLASGGVTPYDPARVNNVAQTN
jgi:hypothetical protein